MLLMLILQCQASSSTPYRNKSAYGRHRSMEQVLSYDPSW